MGITEHDIAIASNKLIAAKQRWGLTDDGGTFKTHSSLLQPVVYKGKRAMLKIPVAAEESRGSTLMVCWNGEGAAQIFEHDENALLMERAVGTRSLREMVFNGNEDEANKIICSVVAKLHQINVDVPGLIPLPVWFRELKPAADKYGGILVDCNNIATQLLDNPAEVVVLHGDIHYDNILDSGTRGWIAIDPKALAGERYFDFANIFCNPDLKTAATPGRLSKQAKVIAKAAGLNPNRLIRWIIAWAGLSAAWTLNDNEDASLRMTIAKIALNELNSF